MNPFAVKESNTLLNYLVSDRDFKIKQSESSQYIEPDSIIELNQLYQDVYTKIQKAHIYLFQTKVNFAHLSEFQYKTETQGGKIAYIRAVLDYFFINSPKHLSQQQDSNQIECDDCKNYETYLQKLQNQIRQHIRLEQQLKLYQQSLQQKIEQQRKQHEKGAQKLSKLKQTVDELKAKQNGYTHKISRLQDENEKLKQDFIKNRSGLLAENSHRAIRDVSHTSQTKSFKGLQQMKQNVLGQRSSHKKDDKKQQRKEARKSIEKRPQSSDKWRNSNTNSIKQLPLAQKMISEKNRQERRKAIQAKFELRR